MSESLPEGVTKAEFSELQTTVRELADALKAQADAKTPDEKLAAHEDVVESRADLDALAKELGVSPSKLREAADKAKRDEEKERLRPLLVELLDEELPAPNREQDEPADDETEPAADEPDDTPAPEEELDTAPVDSAPSIPHWSEKTVGQLLGR